MLYYEEYVILVEHPFAKCHYVFYSINNQKV